MQKKEEPITNNLKKESELPESPIDLFKVNDQLAKIEITDTTDIEKIKRTLQTIHETNNKLDAIQDNSTIEATEKFIEVRGNLLSKIELLLLSHYSEKISAAETQEDLDQIRKEVSDSSRKNGMTLESFKKIKKEREYKEKSLELENTSEMSAMSENATKGMEAIKKADDINGLRELRKIVEANKQVKSLSEEEEEKLLALLEHRLKEFQEKMKDQGLELITIANTDQLIRLVNQSKEMISTEGINTDNLSEIFSAISDRLDDQDDYQKLMTLHGKLSANLIEVTREKIGDWNEKTLELKVAILDRFTEIIAEIAEQVTTGDMATRNFFDYANRAIAKDDLLTGEQKEKIKAALSNAITRISS